MRISISIRNSFPFNHSLESRAGIRMYIPSASFSRKQGCFCLL